MAPPSSSTISIPCVFCRFHFPFLHSSPATAKHPLWIMNPLFSTLVALYTLVLLYFPSFFLSPLLLSVGILLLSLLRLGAAQKQNAHPNNLPLNQQHQTQTEEPPSKRCVSPSEDGNRRASDPDQAPVGSFLEWDVGAPLAVIHEGEEEGAVGCDGHRQLERHPSLSRYYPESDSDSDSDSESSCSAENGEFERSPERGRFRWEEEERDGLIEIKLDSDCGKRKVVEGLDFQSEEDNLIEIDMSPAAGGR